MFYFKQQKIDSKLQSGASYNHLISTGRESNYVIQDAAAGIHQAEQDVGTTALNWNGVIYVLFMIHSQMIRRSLKRGC